MFPFRDGELMPYCGVRDTGVEWKENFVFHDDLRYDGYYRGCSAAGFQFVSEENGKRYNMFLTDFDNAMKTRRFFKDHLIGEFTFVKRGQNYGIKILPAPDDTADNELICGF